MSWSRSSEAKADVPGSLWRNGDFTRLWTAQTISDFGSMVTGMALPLTAIVVLSASPGEMGLLTAAGELPVVAVSLLAGAWVDRVRRRPVLVGTDLGRALLLGSIPVAFLFGQLHMWQLYIVAILASVLAVFSGVAGHSFLPSLLDRSDLAEGNSKLGASNSIAEVSGPPVGGIMVQFLSAPLAIVIDAVSFLVSAVLIGLIRKPEPPPERSTGQTVRQDIGEGLRVVLGSRVLRALAASDATQAFFGNFIGVSYNLYVIRELGLSPTVLGVLIGAGGAGALLGAVISTRTMQRLGLGRAIWASSIFAGLINLGIPLAGGPHWASTTLMLAIQFVGDVAWAIYMIGAVTVRQSSVPSRLLGRSQASTRFLVGTVGPVGALLAGGLGELVGLRLTILLGAAGILLSSLWLIMSPLREYKEAPLVSALQEI